MKALHKSNANISSAKYAKWPVTLVVKRCTARNPATFTIPATNDNKDAACKL
jgi:hypothetical protein